MRITVLETIRANFHDNLIWLHIETDDGLIGLGETFYVPSAVEAYLHDNVAPLLLGGDASRIGAWNARLIRRPVGYASSGVEMRAASAVDIALWDLMGSKLACRSIVCSAASSATASASTTPALVRTTSRVLTAT
jgi:galactonate dehydratase